MKRCQGCYARDGRKCALGFTTTRLQDEGFGDYARKIMYAKQEDCTRPMTSTAWEEAKNGMLGEYRRG
jgi:hypothetical protein